MVVVLQLVGLATMMETEYIQMFSIHTLPPSYAAISS